MSEEEEKVSVLMAVALGEEDSAACQETLRSVAMQTYPSSLIEVVKVQYVASDANGRTSALNAARETATGAFLLQADAGVSFEATKVASQVERLRAAPESDVTVHATTLRAAGERPVTLDLHPVLAYGSPVGVLVKAPWAPGAAMMRRASSNRLGAYRYVREVFWEQAVRAVGKGARIDAAPEALSAWETDDAAQWSTRRALFPDRPRIGFLKGHLEKQTGTGLCGTNGSPVAAELVLAGLHLMNDDLAACHAICQGCERSDPTASYWHGIVHRREPDFENARGWFARAASFGGGGRIAAAVTEVLQRALQLPEYGAARDRAFALLRRIQDSGAWDPLPLVDLYEAARTDPEADGLARLLEEVQEAETRAVFEWTYREAAGDVRAGDLEASTDVA